MITIGKHDECSGRSRAVRLGLLTLLFLGAGAAAYAAAPTPADLEKAAGLVRHYQELKSQLEAFYKAAEAADPNLRLCRAGRAKMKRWYEGDLAPQKQEYVKWRNAHENPREADRMFDGLKKMSGAMALAKGMEDPNGVLFLRDIALPMLIRHAQDPNMVTGPYVKPSEKNRDVLWQGYKRYILEAAADSRKKLDEYAVENNVPPKILQLASDMARGELYLTLYQAAAAERTPPEGRVIQDNILAVCRELAQVLPQWHALMAMADSETQKVMEQVKTEILNNDLPAAQ
jgi:hypothetical protein